MVTVNFVYFKFLNADLNFIWMCLKTDGKGERCHEQSCVPAGRELEYKINYFNYLEKNKN